MKCSFSPQSLNLYLKSVIFLRAMQPLGRQSSLQSSPEVMTGSTSPPPSSSLSSMNSSGLVDGQGGGGLGYSQGIISSHSICGGGQFTVGGGQA